MASPKRSKPTPVVPEDHTLIDSAFIDKGYVSDMRASKTVNERDIQAELLKRFDPTAVIDAFEEQQGIKKKTKAAQFQFKNIVLDPSKAKDQDLLNQLLNDPNFKIVTYKDSFNMKGDYKAFIIYGEKVQDHPQETP